MRLGVRRACALLGLVLAVSSIAAAPWHADAKSAKSAKTGFAIALDGSDSNPCTTERPCRTFNRAYHVAPVGAIVEVRAGSYGDQILSGPRPGGRPVVFRPAPQADVSVGELRTDPNGAGNFEIRGMTLADAYLASGTHDVTLRGNTMQLFYLRTTSNVSIIGGKVGGQLLSPNSPTIGAADTAPSRNTVIDHVLFHDIRIDPSVVPAQHGECLFVQEADGLIIRNSTFRDCSDFDIYFHQISGGGNPRNVVLENNFFGTTTEGGFYTLFFRNDRGESLTNIRVAFNSAAQGFHFDEDGTISNVSVFGNTYGPSRQCSHGVDYQYNVIQGIKCGSTDANAPTGFVDPSTGDRGPAQPASGGNDLHLVRGAKALGFVRAKKRQPVGDIDGDRRPTIRFADAGADQRETAAIVLGKSIGGVRLGQSRDTVEAFYGRPRRVVAKGRGLLVATYRLHGGSVWITFAGKSVVGVATNSNYYAANAGLAAGAPVRTASAVGLRRGGCKGSLQRTFGSVIVSAVARNNRVSSISMMQRRHAAC